MNAPSRSSRRSQPAANTTTTCSATTTGHRSTRTSCPTPSRNSLRGRRSPASVSMTSATPTPPSSSKPASPRLTLRLQRARRARRTGGQRRVLGSRHRSRCGPGVSDLSLASIPTGTGCASLTRQHCSWVEAPIVVEQDCRRAEFGATRLPSRLWCSRSRFGRARSAARELAPVSSCGGRRRECPLSSSQCQNAL